MEVGGLDSNCCFLGVSGLMNVCSVLISTLDYLNPPSKHMPVTHTKGSERSKINPHHIPITSCNHCLLIKLQLSLPSSSI